MKRSLFTELENYTDEALKLSMDIQEVLTPFYENASKEDLSLREIQLIIMDASNQIEISLRTRKRRRPPGAFSR